MANEYKAWYRRNDPQSARVGLEGYKRPFGERYERPPEYSVGSEAYKHYPAMVDISKKQEAFQKGEDSKETQSRTDSDEAKKRAKRTRASNATRGVAQAIAAPVAGIVAGGVILVGGYQAIVESEQEAEATPEIPVVTYMESWEWSDGYESFELTLTDENGTFVATLPAVLTPTGTVKEATCDEEGSEGYTATVTHGGKSYSTTTTKPTAALDHDWTEPQIKDTENGSITYQECNRCHEEIVISVDYEED